MQSGGQGPPGLEADLAGGGGARLPLPFLGQSQEDLGRQQSCPGGGGGGHIAQCSPSLAAGAVPPCLGCWH